MIWREVTCSVSTRVIWTIQTRKVVVSLNQQIRQPVNRIPCDRMTSNKDHSSEVAQMIGKRSWCHLLLQKEKALGWTHHVCNSTTSAWIQAEIRKETLWSDHKYSRNPQNRTILFKLYRRVTLTHSQQVSKRDFKVSTARKMPNNANVTIYGKNQFLKPKKVALKESSFTLLRWWTTKTLLLSTYLLGQQPRQLRNRIEELQSWCGHRWISWSRTFSFAAITANYTSANC
jgi:hypothetical protein